MLLTVSMAVAQSPTLYSIPIIGESGDDNFYYLHMSFGLSPDMVRAPYLASNEYAKCLIDTGSSNMAVAGSSEAASHEFLVQNTYNLSNPNGVNIGQSENMQYVRGGFSGPLMRNNVGYCNPDTSLSTPCEIAVNTEFAVITASSNFFTGGFTCIVGMAYQSIADLGVRPWFGTLVADKVVHNVFATQFCYYPAWALGCNINCDGYNGSALSMWLYCEDCTNVLWILYCTRLHENDRLSPSVIGFMCLAHYRLLVCNIGVNGYDLINRI